MDIPVVRSPSAARENSFKLKYLINFILGRGKRLESGIISSLLNLIPLSLEVNIYKIMINHKGIRFRRGEITLVSGRLPSLV